MPPAPAVGIELLLCFALGNPLLLLAEFALTLLEEPTLLVEPALSLALSGATDDIAEFDSLTTVGALSW